jgi:hypothetical protein
MGMRPIVLVCATALLAVTTVPAATAQTFPDEAPSVVGDHAAWLSITNVSGSLYSSSPPSSQTRASQLAVGPGPNPARVYLYVSSPAHGIRRFRYDPVTGALSHATDLLPTIRGNGLALRTDASGRLELYATDSYASLNAPTRKLGRLWRFADTDGDGSFDSAGDVAAAIARGVPGGAHGLNQIQIHGNTLYVGSGTRTVNGARQSYTGDTLGESAFGGALLLVEDLEAVASVDDAAGFAAYSPHPTELEYRRLIDGTTPGAEAPYTSTAPDKLRVHSAGTRNPFGVAVDHDGTVWMSVNFHRVDNTTFDRHAIGDGADLDGHVGRSSDDVHDQLFRAVDKADYGYRNGHWQDHPAARAAGFFAGVSDPARVALSLTFDNYDQGGTDPDAGDPAFNTFHDPSAPRGLGPHSAVTGLASSPVRFPTRYYDHLFAARWNGQFGILDGLDYRDLVLVDAALGDVERVAAGFNAPIDVVDDGYGHLLVASYFGGIWRLAPKVHRCGGCVPRTNGDDRSAVWSSR